MFLSASATKLAPNPSKFGQPYSVKTPSSLTALGSPVATCSAIPPTVSGFDEKTEYLACGLENVKAGIEKKINKVKGIRLSISEDEAFLWLLVKVVKLLIITCLLVGITFASEGNSSSCGSSNKVLILSSFLKKCEE